MSSNPPSPAPKSLGEKLLSELPDLLMLAEQADTNYKALPHPAKAVDYGHALGFLPGSVSMAILSGFDTIKAGAHVTVDEVASLLGIDPAGVLGKAIHIGEVLAS